MANDIVILREGLASHGFFHVFSKSAVPSVCFEADLSDCYAAIQSERFVAIRSPCI